MVAITPVEPLVVEVEVDTAFEHGRWRHPVGYVRLRPDLRVADVTAVSHRAEAVPDH